MILKAGVVTHHLSAKLINYLQYIFCKQRCQRAIQILLRPLFNIFAFASQYIKIGAKRPSNAGKIRLKYIIWNIDVLTCLVGIWMPIFSIAFANSSGSTVPLSFRSKYLNAFMRTCSSDWAPRVFSANLFFNSLSKLYQSKLNKNSLN